MTLGSGGDMFNLSCSFIREFLLHCESQTHLCTRHNVVSAPVKRAIVCGKPFGRKVGQTIACHALKQVSRVVRVPRVQQARYRSDTVQP